MPLWGWDMSHYDAPGIDDAIAEGFSFITHKAGGDANDAELAAWWSGVKGLKPSACLLGAYWVLYPGNPVGRADAFLARLDSQCPGWRDRPFILQVDCEIWGGNRSTMPGLADIRAFCDRLKSKCPKLRPIVYAPKWCYGETLKGLPYPLWASSYVNGSGYASKLYPGDTSSRWGAYSGQTPAILQFTSSATIAGQTTCDANAFRGTLAQLTALLAPGWVVNVALTTAEINAIAQAVATKFYTELTNTASGLYKVMVGSEGRVNAATKATVAPVVPAITTAQAALTSALDALAARDYVDEQAIATAVAAILPPNSNVTPETIADGLEVLYRRMYGQPVPPAAMAYDVPRAGERLDGEPVDDDADRAGREEVQRRIAGAGE